MARPQILIALLASTALVAPTAAQNAGQTLSTLPTATPLTGSELLYTVQGGVSKQTTVGAVGSEYTASDPRVAPFNAKCDGSNPPNYDTAALQAWAAAATNPNGNQLTLPAGCIVNGTITFSQPFSLTGTGPSMQQSGTAYATLAQVNATADTFAITTSQAWSIRDVGIRAATVRTAGADIHVIGDGTNIPAGFVIDAVGFESSFTCISIDKGTDWKIVNSNCHNFGYAGGGYGVYYPSTGWTDWADDSIIGNTFSTGTSGTGQFYGYAGTYLESSQAVFIQGNKYIGGQFGVFLNANTSSGTLLISGNSFEQHVQSHVNVQQKTSGGAVANLVITGNEFSNLSNVSPAVTTTAPTVWIGQGLSTAYINNVVVANNVWNDFRTTTWPSLALYDGIGDSITGNVFNLYNQTGPISIAAGSNITNAFIGDNTFNNQTTAQHYGGPTITYLSTIRIRDTQGQSFADLSGWANGSEVYCVNCTPGSTLTGSGSGAWGRRINGAWVGN